LMSARWGMRGYYINAIALMTASDSSLVEEIRSKVADQENGQENYLFAVTLKQGLVICRYMGNSVDEAKDLFKTAWSAWRDFELGKSVVFPRIWGT